jgi:1-acyl-sn-glycerol-3-phosphate acyltransferase
MAFLRSLIYDIYFALTILLVGGLGSITVLFNKKHALDVVNVWSRVALWGLKYIQGITVEVRGLENLRDGKVMVAGKHLSTLDTVAPFTMMNTPAFIFKKELFKVPIFGWYLDVAGMIPIDRDGGMAALKGMVAEAKVRLEENRPILIFPEGTRKPIGAEPDYKPGVAAIYGMLGVPCVPLALNTGYYWKNKGMLKRPGKVVFEFLEPIEPGLKRQEFMHKLETAIETRTAALVAEASETQ